MLACQRHIKERCAHRTLDWKAERRERMSASRLPVSLRRALYSAWRCCHDVSSSASSSSTCRRTGSNSSWSKTYVSRADSSNFFTFLTYTTYSLSGVIVTPSASLIHSTRTLECGEYTFTPYRQSSRPFSAWWSCHTASNAARNIGMHTAVCRTQLERPHKCWRWQPTGAAPARPLQSLLIDGAATALAPAWLTAQMLVTAAKLGSTGPAITEGSKGGAFASRTCLDGRTMAAVAAPRSASPRRAAVLLGPGASSSAPSSSSSSSSPALSLPGSPGGAPSLACKNCYGQMLCLLGHGKTRPLKCTDALACKIKQACDCSACQDMHPRRRTANRTDSTVWNWPTVLFCGVRTSFGMCAMRLLCAVHKVQFLH